MLTTTLLYDDVDLVYHWYSIHCHCNVNTWYTYYIREEKIELFPPRCKNLALWRANLELFVQELTKKQPKP